MKSFYEFFDILFVYNTLVYISVSAQGVLTLQLKGTPSETAGKTY
jgi:hypothetical protein